MLRSPFGVNLAKRTPPASETCIFCRINARPLGSYWLFGAEGIAAVAFELWEWKIKSRGLLSLPLGGRQPCGDMKERSASASSVYLSAVMSVAVLYTGSYPRHAGLVVGTLGRLRHPEPAKQLIDQSELARQRWLIVRFWITSMNRIRVGAQFVHATNVTAEDLVSSPAGLCYARRSFDISITGLVGPGSIGSTARVMRAEKSACRSGRKSLAAGLTEQLDRRSFRLPGCQPISNAQVPSPSPKPRTNLHHSGAISAPANMPSSERFSTVDALALDMKRHLRRNDMCM